MKTYREAVKHFGERAFNHYMSGSLDPFQYVNAPNIAFIYDKHIKEVNDDLFKAFTDKMKEYRNEL